MLGGAWVCEGGSGHLRRFTDKGGNAKRGVWRYEGLIKYWDRAIHELTTNPRAKDYPQPPKSPQRRDLDTSLLCFTSAMPSSSSSGIAPICLKGV